jgi:hypothetical protein
MRIDNLEELSNHLMDNWKSGNYTFGYNDQDALATGTMMSEIFIEEARKKFPGEEQSEIMWHAERVQEVIDEQASKYRD